MGVDDWKRVIDKCWDAGIPHITFTGGEATIVPYLRELIEHAEDVGLVTGLLSNGRHISDRYWMRAWQRSLQKRSSRRVNI